MKNLQILWVALVAALMAVFSTSCGGHADEVVLPADTTQVGQVVPIVNGTIGQYLEVVPKVYRINLKDSVLTMSVDFRVTKQWAEEPMTKTVVCGTQTDEVLTLGFVGENGEPLDLELALGEDGYDRIVESVEGQPGQVFTIDFVERAPVSVEQRDSLSLLAYNLTVFGNIFSIEDVEQKALAETFKKIAVKAMNGNKSVCTGQVLANLRKGVVFFYGWEYGTEYDVSVVSAKLTPVAGKKNTFNVVGRLNHGGGTIKSTMTFENQDGQWKVAEATGMRYVNPAWAP